MHPRHLFSEECMAKNVTDINADQAQELILNYPGKAILDFYSDECSPCEALAPKFEEYADLFEGEIKFYKIFRQQNRDFANTLGVKGSPTLLFFENGKEATGRLMGEVRKWQLGDAIRSMVGDELYERVMSKKQKQVKEVDVAILGGGPAGLTAGIYASQAKLSTVLIDQALPGGQVKITHMMSNYPGTGGPISGMELMDKMDWQARNSGVEVIGAVDVSSVELNEQGGPHILRLDGDDIEIRAHAVVLGMGSEPRPLNVPGEKELKGQGISYCATCDGKYFEDQEVIVIGGGNSAVEESLFLTRFASKVNIVHQFDHLQANKTAQEQAYASDKIGFVWNSEPRKFEKTQDGKMKVTLENVKTHETSEMIADGVFIFVGYIPNTHVIQQSLEKDNWGYLKTNEDMETRIPGVYAVGDIRSKKWRQAATAVSDGAIAGIVAEKYVESKKHKKQGALAGAGAGR